MALNQYSLKESVLRLLKDIRGS